MYLVQYPMQKIQFHKIEKELQPNREQSRFHKEMLWNVMKHIFYTQKSANQVFTSVTVS